MSRKYKFIYLHVLKSGGMSLKTFLKMGMCGTVDVVRKRGCGPNDDFELMEIVDCSKAVKTHPGYLIWSFVRNPYGRMYSAFSMAKHGHKRPGSTDDTTFEMFAENTGVMGKVSTTSPAHWANQVNYVFTSKGTCPAVDFLGRIEFLHEDMAALLKVIKSPELDKYFKEVGIGQARETSFGARLAVLLHLLISFGFNGMLQLFMAFIGK